MKRFSIFLFLLYTAVITVSARAGSPGTLTVYPAPEGAEQAPDFQLFVNGREVFVYDNPVAAYAYFDFEGEINIEIRPVIDVKWVDVRPLRVNIRPEWNNNIIKFKITQPCNISVELNRHIQRPLFIFANPPEKDIPDRNDKNVLFFGSGKIHDVGLVEIKP